jgi:hypothetical protein
MLVLCARAVWCAAARRRSSALSPSRASSAHRPRRAGTKWSCATLSCASARSALPPCRQHASRAAAHEQQGAPAPRHAPSGVARALPAAVLPAVAPPSAHSRSQITALSSRCTADAPSALHCSSGCTLERLVLGAARPLSAAGGVLDAPPPPRPPRTWPAGRLEQPRTLRPAPVLGRPAAASHSAYVQHGDRMMRNEGAGHEHGETPWAGEQPSRRRCWPAPAAAPCAFTDGGRR